MLRIWNDCLAVHVAGVLGDIFGDIWDFVKTLGFDLSRVGVSELF